MAIQNRIEKGTNPSIVVGVIDKDGPRYYCFGKTSLTGTTVNEHTIYEIGSISKVFTGILLAYQSQAGKVKVDDPVQKYLPPDVRMPQRGGKEITLGHLSDHTSGLPRLPSNFNPKDFMNPYQDYTVSQLHEFVSGYSLPRDIGAEYEYSNVAQGLLGHVLALNANVPYETLMINIIARPLKMFETKVVLDDNMKLNLAIGHNEGEEVSNWDIPTLAGAGGIRSSAHDMLRFLAANIGLTATPLRSAMDESHEVRHGKANGTRVGLGWHIRKGDQGDVISHSGGTGGYRTFAGFVKETQTGVIVFTNSTVGVDEIGFSLLDQGSTIAKVKPTIAQPFRLKLDSSGVDAAIAFYHDAKKNHTDDYEFAEGVLTTLGYDYMEKNPTIALALFQLNTTEYPNSYNSYESYAEGLLKAGDTVLATENYRVSLALNPSNTNAKAALAKLGVKWERPFVYVAEETLQAYTGTYTVFKGMDFVVTYDGGQLFGQSTGSPRVKLVAKSVREFYVEGVNATLTFNANGKTVTLHQLGQDMTGKKVQ
jgi:CubicO group peptidase (beta-lactamase class C family)